MPVTTTVQDPDPTRTVQPIPESTPVQSTAPTSVTVQDES